MILPSLRRTIPAVLGVYLAASLTAGPPALAQDAGSACLGQLMLFGGTYCPRGYAEANGDLLPIQNFTALYSLYGTTYGGDGVRSFGLPDLRGRAPIGQGQGPGLPNYNQGEKTGSPTVTIQQPNLPPVSPSVNAVSGAPGAGTPNGAYLANGSNYATSGFMTKMAPGMIGPLGNGIPMTTQNPIQAIRWCVAVQGIYCSRQ